MDSKVLAYNYTRSFGVEIEVNSLDRRDFINYPLKKGHLPLGVDYIGDIIAKNFNVPVVVNLWHYTNNNAFWVIKPDSSCGIELCSPVSKGKYGLDQICQVINLISSDSNISIDKRCSLHVHVNVKDCETIDIAAILAWWIKCEAVFIDSIPQDRKRSRYCQYIAASDIFDTNFRDYSRLVKYLGSHKYFTANSFHLLNDERKTVEFRILGNEGCNDSDITRNWIKLLIHFVEMAKKISLPKPWKNNDDYTRGLLILDPKDVFRFLGFLDYELSDEMIGIRNWFLRRLKKNIVTDLQGFWSPASRVRAIQEVDELICELKMDMSITPTLKGRGL
jgi:hypothetical protein